VPVNQLFNISIKYQISFVYIQEIRLGDRFVINSESVEKGRTFEEFLHQVLIFHFSNIII